jgi:hypothetical protein
VALPSAGARREGATAPDARGISQKKEVRFRLPPLAPVLGLPREFTELLVAPASTEQSRISFARTLGREACPAAVGIAAGFNQRNVEVFLLVFVEREASVAAAGYCCVARLGMDRPSGCATAGFGSMSICGSAVRHWNCPLASLISEQLAGFFHAL